MRHPRVLIYDIETTPMTVYAWGLRDQNISLNQIKKEWSVMAWSAKWLGDSASKVMYYDLRKSKNIEDDLSILLPLWKLLDEADIVITQNGKNFDSPKVNARFILHGLKPPSPYKHLDTYQIIRKAAKFTSNKLEYLTAKLCTKYKKLAHSKFPGMSLWNQCLAGNLKAWDEMKRYNIHDVLATEELYTKIRAWAPVSMVKPYDGHGCTTCNAKGSLLSNGYRRTKKGYYRRLVCIKCGVWTHDAVKGEASNGQ